MSDSAVQIEQAQPVSPDEERRASEYQSASAAYYDQMRDSHSSVFTSRSRMEEEQRKKRYTHVKPPELEDSIQNLGSFIRILRALCGSGPQVRGIDFGCGSHWFVDFVRTDPEYRWSAVGYDPDQHAIELARHRFPQSAEFYRCRDPLRDGLPSELTATQHFVFCNAVLQHFDDDEADRALAEISRVLRPGGYAMLIFKCWDDELLADDAGMDQPPRILDAEAGKVLFFDPTMKKAIDAMPPDERSRLDDDTRNGWRLFHVFRVNHVVEIAARHQLAVASELAVKDGSAISGLVTFRSGKKMPTACVVLAKQNPTEEVPAVEVVRV